MRRKSYLGLTNIIKSPKVAQVATEEPTIDKNSWLHTKESTDSKSLSQLLEQVSKLSTDELGDLFSSDSDYLLDRLMNKTPMIIHLKKERDILKKQVSNLCSFNYAREPDSARDRKRIRELLDETSALRRRTIRNQHPLLDQLGKVHCQISTDAVTYEEESERLAQDFLAGNMDYNKFVQAYVDVRKKAIRKRALADKLGRDKSSLADSVPEHQVTNSPIPTPRLKKRVSLPK